VPQDVAAIAVQNKAPVYNLLFRATAETLRIIAADPRHLGAELGFFAVLHTWGQTLVAHPHLHCVIPGGGLSPDGTQWVPCRRDFFLPVRVLSRLFRRLFLQLLQAAYDAERSAFRDRSHHSRIDPPGRAPSLGCGRPTGSSTPSARSPVQNRSSTTSGVTPTAWPTVHYFVTAPGQKPLSTQLYFSTDEVFGGDPDKNYAKDPLITSRTLVRPVTLTGKPESATAAVEFELVMEKA